MEERESHSSSVRDQERRQAQLQCKPGADDWSRRWGERDRKAERQRERQMDRETQRDRDTERQGDRETACVWRLECGTAWTLRPVSGEKRWKEAVSLFSGKLRSRSPMPAGKRVCCPGSQAWLARRAGGALVAGIFMPSYPHQSATSPLSPPGRLRSGLTLHSGSRRCAAAVTAAPETVTQCVVVTDRAAAIPSCRPAFCPKRQANKNVQGLPPHGGSRLAKLQAGKTAPQVKCLLHGLQT